jgi:hypothetical protein
MENNSFGETPLIVPAYKPNGEKLTKGFHFCTNIFREPSLIRCQSSTDIIECTGREKLFMT